jgi:hypothetical protein
MGFRQHREAVHSSVVNHRHDDGMVCGVRVAVIGRIMEERVPALEGRMEGGYALRHQIGAA